MEDNTELIIDHKGKGAALDNGEVDIVLGGENTTTSGREPHTEDMARSSKPANRTDVNIKSTVLTGTLNNNQEEMKDYPLPTPKISEMAPPAPPAVSDTSDEITLGDFSI